MKRALLVVVLAGVTLSAAPAAWAQGDQAPAPPAPAPPPAPGQRGPGPMGSGPMARPDLGKWWKNSEIARELGLTEQQISQIEATFYDQRLKLIDLNADVQRNEARLQPLMEADAVDEAKISAHLDQLLAARSRLEKANMMMMISIRKVLSVEQWRKLEGIRERRERPMMRGPQTDGPESPRGGMMRRQGPPRPPESENF